MSSRLVPIVLIVSVAALLAGCMGGEPFEGEEEPVPPGTPAGPSDGRDPDNPATDEVKVDMLENVYDPTSVWVAPGTAVTFVNEGNETHTAMLLETDQDTGDVPPGGAESLVFEAEGKYRFECRYHGDRGMVGAVYVVEG